MDVLHASQDLFILSRVALVEEDKFDLERALVPLMLYADINLETKENETLQKTIPSDRLTRV